MVTKQHSILGVLLIASTLLAGCESKASRERAQQLVSVSAEKDSLLALVAENARLVSEIGSELSKVREVRRPMTAVVSPETPGATTMSYKDSLMGRMRDVVTRVNQAEQRLAASQRRLRTLASESDSAKAHLALIQQTVNDLRATMENQRTTMEQMTSEITQLKEANTQLTTKTVAMTDTLNEARTKMNTVYYIIGTKDELKEKGIIVEEGKKFLVFGGKTLAPARDIPSEAFKSADMRVTSEIPLPDPAKEYRIVSRQNLEFLGNGVTPDGKVTGSIQIKSPEAFWEPSKYLIIVEG